MYYQKLFKKYNIKKYSTTILETLFKNPKKLEFNLSNLSNL